MNHMHKSRRGTTMIEVTIVAIILSVVLLITFSILFTSTQATMRGELAGSIESQGRLFVDYTKAQFHTAIFDDASGAPFMGIRNEHTWVGFKIPVARQANGDLLYGYSTSLGLTDLERVGWSCVLRFEPDEVVEEGQTVITGVTYKTTIAPLPGYPTMKTTKWNFDVNRDGDKFDTFVRGPVIKYVIGTTELDGQGKAKVDAFGVRIEVPPYVVYKEVVIPNVILGCVGGSSYTADVDGYLKTPVEFDKMFSYVDPSGALVENPTPTVACVGVSINVWHGLLDDVAKGYFVRRTSEVARFRNR